MEFGSIERELRIDAAPEVVFEVLSSPEHIAQWWRAEADLEPVAGSSGSLAWTDEQGVQVHRTQITIVESEPPRTFTFRWTHEPDEVAAPGNSMLVTFELVPDGDGTRLTFVESGFRERGWEAAVLEAQYNDHSSGWDLYLPRLAQLAGRLAAAR